MNTARPMVSNTHSAGSGMRPNVGRTDRNQPKTRPMMSAPPLAVSVSGTPATLTDNMPNKPADQHAEADEHDVGFARRTFEVADRLADACDVEGVAGDAQQVARSMMVSSL